jgi:amino-acid N-acetyltransferase
MPDTGNRGGPAGPFSEKGFYLAEFRGRTLAIAVRAADLAATAPLASVLKELEENGTRVVLITDDAATLPSLLDTRSIPADAARLEARVWRELAAASRAGVALTDPGAFAPACRELVLRLGVTKLMWIDGGGGLARPDGRRLSFVDLLELRALLETGLADGSEERRSLLAEIEAALRAGLPAVTLCTLEGLADELFTYAGSGTYFSRDNYVEVRRLGVDDFDAADDLLARGVAEGYLVPRSPEEIEGVLGHGFGAFVEGRYLAGIGALLLHQEGRAGEIASLYTLTRFLGEGIGGHLIRHAVERARAQGCGFVFACTGTERVAGFFERHGFSRVSPDKIPAEKWRDYDDARRKNARCLRLDLG